MLESYQAWHIARENLFLVKRQTWISTDFVFLGFTWLQDKDGDDSEEDDDEQDDDDDDDDDDDEEDGDDIGKWVLFLQLFICISFHFLGNSLCKVVSQGLLGGYPILNFYGSFLYCVGNWLVPWSVGCFLTPFLFQSRPFFVILWGYFCVFLLDVQVSW